MRSYRVNDIFLSIQGEGVRAGTLNVFVRLSKCNMRCVMAMGDRSPGGFDCDTEFESGQDMTAKEILEECERLWPTDRGGKWVVWTGGEPALQLDDDLLLLFRDAGWRSAVETNGSILLPHRAGRDEMDTLCTEDGLMEFFPLVDWITVSPKVAEHAIRQRWAHEVKYVRGGNQSVPVTTVKALNKLVSPAFDGDIVDRPALRRCIEIVMSNPDWRVSVQLHKAMGVR